MLNSQEKVIHVVAGPTGAGKTSFALQLAKEINGELISADSRQIYRYMSIGTNVGNFVEVGRVDYGEGLNSFPLHQDSGVNIHLLSFLEPDERFSVAQFQELAFAAIEYIFAQGKVPILVGGTGLYIASVINPQSFQFNSEVIDVDYREYLNALPKDELTLLAKESVSDAFEKLNLDDQQNPRRLIRLIERSRNITSSGEIKIYPEFKVVKHYLDRPMEELDTILRERVDEMWETDLVDEVKKLMDKGYNENTPGLQAPGYKEVMQFLTGSITDMQCKELIYLAHRQYAKRQRTWLKKYFV